MKTLNLYHNNPPKKGEIFTSLLEHKNVKIVRIISASNFEPTEYIQEEDEWVALLEGEAILVIGAEKTVLKKGESVFIPAQTPHRIEQMQQGAIWLAVHIL